jgi:hypothetical protein
MDAQKPLRDHLLWLLRSGGAHVTLAAAVDGLPPALAGASAPGLPHTAWQLVEHLRIAQRDILDFCRDPEAESPPWPDGFWPPPAPPGDDAWPASLAALDADLAALEALVADPATDLFAQLPWGAPGVTLLREALLVADHNAYHAGQLVDLRRALGRWPAAG